LIINTREDDMYSRRMMIVGVILVLASIAIFVFAIFMIGEEEQLLKKAVRFDGGAAGAGQGVLVIVEGRVSAKNRILVHDFVDAEKEHNDAGSWGVLEQYRQPVLADLARGEIILTAKYVCVRPEGNNILKTNERTSFNDPVRFIGLRRGDPITAVGTLTSLVPAALAVKDWYSGSIAEYRDSLTTNRKTGYIGCAVMIVLGAGLFIWGLKSR
jgi:hypothetical protein